MPDTRHPTLSSAHSEVEILEAVARFCWWEDHESDCPPGMIPTLRNLADLLEEDPEAGISPRQEGVSIWWNLEVTRPILSEVERAELEGHLRDLENPEAERLRGFLEGVDQIPPIRVTSLTAQSASGPWSVAQAHTWRQSLPAERRGVHPLGGLVRAWQRRPHKVQADRGHPRPLFPHMRLSEAPERAQGRLVFGLAPAGREAQLPLPSEVMEKAKSVLEEIPLLALSDASGVPVTSAGQGAPLELAVPVEAFLSIKPVDRKRESVRLAISIRELRDGLWPRGWQRGRDWPRLQGVLRGLNTRYIPWAKGGEWYPILLRGLPSPGAGLDELVMLDVSLPPGGNEGAPINRGRLAELRPQSGGAYRALIAVTALCYRLGRTRVKTQGRHWWWAGDPSRYPILTRQDRHDIVFGVGTNKRHRDKEVDAPFKALELAGDLWIQDRGAFDRTRYLWGWRIVAPREAIQAVRGWLAKQTPT